MGEVMDKKFAHDIITLLENASIEAHLSRYANSFRDADSHYDRLVGLHKAICNKVRSEVDRADAAA